MAYYSASISCLNLADLSSFISEGATDNDLNFHIDVKSDGWFRETVTFWVVGTDYNVRRFKFILESALREYNR